MSEMYVAVADVIGAAMVPNYPRPRYLPEAPPQTVGQYKATLAKLGRLGIVKES